MKNIKRVLLPVTLLLTIAVISAFTTMTSSWKEVSERGVIETKPNQTVNLFVSHGHCCLPFSGTANDIKISTSQQEDQVNFMEDMQISFAIDPHSFKTNIGEEFTEQVKTPGLFMNERYENITFQSTNIYKVGKDWYQINGKLTIKGEEQEVKFFATGIRKANETIPSALILEGQLNLFDWGIDYEKIVNNNSREIITKWMHINMTIELS